MATKIKYDVTESDPDRAIQPSSFESPKPGMYVATIQDILPKDGRNPDTNDPDPDYPMLEVIFEVTDADKKTNKKYAGSRMWWYPLLQDHPSFKAVPWKLDQLLLSTGVASKRKRKGTVDLDTLVGQEVVIVVRSGKNQDGDYRGEVGQVLPYDEDTFGADVEDEDEDGIEVDDEDIEETEDEEEDEDTEEEEEDEEPDEDEEPEEEEESTGEYSDMILRDLRKEARSRDIDTDGLSKQDLIDALEEDDEGGGEEPEEEEEEEEPAPRQRRKPTAARRKTSAKKPTARKKATASRKKTTTRRKTAATTRKGGRGRGDFPFE